MRRGSVGLERLGVIRGPRERTGPFKEWLHLCATGPSGSLLLNLSFERVDGEIRRRALVIGRDGDASVVRVVQPRAAATSFVPGHAAARVGGCGFAWRGDRARVEVDTPDGSVRAQLELRATATPAWTGSIPMPPGAELFWMVAPRWRVEGGKLCVNGRRLHLDRWQAYHDHNWGRFRWSDDFAWEWAFGLADDPAAPGCVVFGRLTDRAGARVLSKVLMLWWHGRQLRTLRGGDVELELVGTLRREGARPAPGVAGLLLPEQPVDVPRMLRVRGRTDHDDLHVELGATCTHRILVPEDGNPIGYRVLNEGFGDARVEGRVAGHAVGFGGPASVEVLRHG
ncbi:MAG: hypothetical protein KC501_23170 [Myxococcales bacterium]|nr:hypothetical protein [Myxococcales bacterium]